MESLSANQTVLTQADVVRIGLIQHACGVSPDDNRVKAFDMIRQAAGGGAKVVFTQELFSTRYFPQTEDVTCFDLAEPIPGPTTTALAQLASELNIHLVAGVFEKCAPGVYFNTAVSFNDQGQIVGLYRKMHIPDDPGFYEKYYFTPGNLGWQVSTLGNLKVGTLICWDQWFPEAARLTAMGGSQLLAYPTAIGYAPEDASQMPTQRDAWQTVQRAAAIANSLFVIAINRVGREENLTFWGSSFVADPMGRVIAEASESREQVLLADCDLSQIEQTRRDWPFFRDRRIDAYEALTQRWGSVAAESRETPVMPLCPQKHVS